MSCSVSCAEMEELAPDYVAGRMYWIESIRYRLHMVACRRCRERVQRMLARASTRG